MTKISNQYSLTNILTADLANSRLGINNGSPTVALDVTGAGKFSSSVSVIIGTSTDPALIVSGNTSATISGNAKRLAQFRYNTGDATGVDLGYDATAGNGVIAGGTSANGAGLDFWTYNGSAWGNRMTLTKAGNVGIGTSSPSEQLTLSRSSYPTVKLIDTTDNAQGYFQYHTDNNYFILNAQSNHPLLFGTNDTERLQIASAGRIFNSNAPANDFALTITGSATTSQSYGVNIYAGTNSSDIAFQAMSRAGNALLRVRGDGFIITGTQSVSPYNNPTSGRTMVIESGGGLGYTSSTRESKANINSISSVAWVNSLNPVSFNYRKKDNNRNYTEEFYNEVSYGFIADEVEKINKDLVFYNTDNKLAGVEYNSMIAILTKAIQELSAENTSLINRIEALENK
jgi:hypothetical protein